MGATHLGTNGRRHRRANVDSPGLHPMRDALSANRPRNIGTPMVHTIARNSPGSGQPR
jgi:hypothetical protein